ncbi:hypothetical protein GCM10023331_23550 [Algivirga pacifica]|uniref:Type ISP restriction-modification enzyme LLaBIII C-terminal specificity domain-containing protein n=2 Tax=Algivirga pacifica TaxID=1162670 RepID=A0ABP9DAQ4_9BACT
MQTTNGHTFYASVEVLEALMAQFQQDIQQDIFYRYAEEMQYDHAVLELIQLIEDTEGRRISVEESLQYYSKHLVMSTILTYALGQENNLGDSSVYQCMEVAGEVLLERSQQQKRKEQLVSRLQSIGEPSIIRDLLCKVVLMLAMDEEVWDVQPLSQNIQETHLGESTTIEWIAPNYFAENVHSVSGRLLVVTTSLEAYYWVFSQYNQGVFWGNVLGLNYDDLTYRQQFLPLLKDKQHQDMVGELGENKPMIILGQEQYWLKEDYYVSKVVTRETRRFFKKSANKKLSNWLVWSRLQFLGKGFVQLYAGAEIGSGKAYQVWRKEAWEFCDAIYIEQITADRYLYTFVFDKTYDGHKVFFASKDKEFGKVLKESSSWLLGFSEEYLCDIPLYSTYEQAVFESRDTRKGVLIDAEYLDLQRTALINKVQKDFRNQIDSEEDKQQFFSQKVEVRIFSEKNIHRVWSQPFLKSWAYTEEVPLMEGPSLLWSAGSYGISAAVVKGAVEQSLLKQYKAILLPLKYLNDNGTETYSISKDIVKAFWKRYAQPLEGALESSLSIEALNVLKEKVSEIETLTKSLPVLYKFSRQLTDILSQQQGEELVDQLNMTIQAFQQKIKRLFSGVKERKTLMNRLVEQLQQFSDCIYALDKQRMDALEKYRSVTEENIFYYCIAIVMNKEYQKQYKTYLEVAPPRIPFLKDFWMWSEKGKALVSLWLAGASESVALQTEDLEELKGTRMRLTQGTIVFPDGTRITNLPDEVLNLRFGGKLLIERLLNAYRPYCDRDLKEGSWEDLPVTLKAELMRSLAHLTEVAVKQPELYLPFPK